MSKLKIEIVRVAEIRCDYCEDWAADKFFSDENWKSIDGSTLCSECVIKQRELD